MSKNTLNQLTPEAKQTIIGWIDDDPNRGPGKALAVTRVRNQFHIEASQEELLEFHFDWHFQHVLEASNITPENRTQLLKALKGLGQHQARLQDAAFSLLTVLAMKSGDLRQLGQIVKLSMKYKDLDLRQSVHELNQQRSATKAGTANLPIGSSLGAPLPLSSSPLASLASPLALSSLPLAAQPLSSVLAARVAEVEKTQGPLSEAAKAEIAQSILADTLKSVKRSV